MRPCSVLHPEWQKMIAGLPYNTHDIALRNARLWAKSMCFRINTSLIPSKRQTLLSKLFPKLNGAEIGSEFYCDYGVNIEFGNGVIIGDNVVILDAGKVSIGSNTKIGNNVVISAVSHALREEDRRSGVQVAKSIMIGNNVIIEENVTVLMGSVIADNSLIKAGHVLRTN